MQGRPAAEACPRLNGEKKLHGTLNICKVAAQLQLAVLALVGYSLRYLPLSAPERMRCIRPSSQRRLRRLWTELSLS